MEEVRGGEGGKSVVGERSEEGTPSGGRQGEREGMGKGGECVSYCL